MLAKLDLTRTPPTFAQLLGSHKASPEAIILAKGSLFYMTYIVCINPLLNAYYCCCCSYVVAQNVIQCASLNITDAARAQPNLVSSTKSTNAFVRQ